MACAERPRLGVSSCVVGRKVRYDGTAKRNRWVVEQLGRHVDLQPVCPEVGIGLGTPRPPIRLAGTPDDYRVVGVRDPSVDVTDALEGFALDTAATLGDVSGYIFMDRSPSCGMERVKLYTPGGKAERKGAGAYARVLMQCLPHLPCEEAGRLGDPVRRENFVNRVYAYRRWQNLRRDGVTAEALVDFHTRHEYLVITHSSAAYQRMGRLLSQRDGVDLERVADTYEAELMTALKRRVGRRRHVDVLRLVQCQLENRIDGDARRELVDSIESYRREEVPLAVPMTRLRSWFRRHPDDHVGRQWYLDPYPESLGLRNAI